MLRWGTVISNRKSETGAKSSYGRAEIVESIGKIGLELKGLWEHLDGVSVLLFVKVVDGSANFEANEKGEEASVGRNEERLG
jgi:hypothetical protein